MGKISNDLDAFRKAQHLNGKLELDTNNVLNNLTTAVSLLEAEVDYYQKIVATNLYADLDGNVLQPFK